MNHRYQNRCSRSFWIQKKFVCFSTDASDWSPSVTSLSSIESEGRVAAVICFLPEITPCLSSPPISFTSCSTEFHNVFSSDPLLQLSPKCATV